MSKLTKVLEVKANDNGSTAVGKQLISEGLRYAVAFGTIGLIFIGIGKIEAPKKVEEEIQEETAE